PPERPANPLPTSTPASTAPTAARMLGTTRSRPNMPALIPVVRSPNRAISQPALVARDLDRLAAIPGAQLPDRDAQVVANGPLGKEQVARDLAGSLVLGRGGEHVSLALGERADAVGDRRGGEAGVDDAPPRVHLADRVRQLPGRRILQEEPGGAALDGAAEIAGTAERGQDQRPCPGQVEAELRGRRDAVLARHLDVEERDVRVAGERGREHLVAAPHLRHDLDVRLEPEQARERTSHHCLVLGDQHADHIARTGTLRRTRNPPSGRAAASNVPSRSRARSASPASPMPAPPAATAAPSSSTSTATAPPWSRMRIAQRRAPLWRTTFVAASRTTQARTVSTSAGRGGTSPSTRQSIPAAARVARALASASANDRCR